MKHIERIIGAGLIIAATLTVGVSAPSDAVSKTIGMPGSVALDTAQAGASLKQNVQARKKRRRGPCVSGDTYNKVDRSCKGAGSAAYARGDRAAGRCKAGDRYNSRKKVCRTKDKKRYPADMKMAASIADSKKAVKERRMKRRSARASKFGCNPGDTYSNRRKMCVHYYKGKK